MRDNGELVLGPFLGTPSPHVRIPLGRGGQVLGEIDIDSDTPAAFSQDDRWMLEAVAAMLAKRL